MKKIIDKLYQQHNLSKEEWIALFNNRTPELEAYLFQLAREVTAKTYGNKIFIRGLIEFSNYCKNDCFYCGIRHSNKNVSHYRLSNEEILKCCEIGYASGYRTFVLQGGEDPYFTRERMVHIIKDIHANYPDCAITLSIGERSFLDYQAFFDAGADRYLLRHETFLDSHYQKLHPQAMSSANRKECLFNLKKIGYQTGSGFMVGSPYQTNENLAEDMLFIKKLSPEMVGIGPYISHKDTPFHEMPSGSVSKTLFILGLLRLMMPTLLIPSTTALGALDKDGRLLGIKCGANVLMQNITPQSARINYTLYENKDRAGDVDNDKKSPLFEALLAEGYIIASTRGDALVSEGEGKNV